MRRRLACGALLVAILAAAPFWLRSLAQTVHEARLLPLRASRADAQEFLEGPAYRDALEAIRATIPANGSYAFVGSPDRARIKWIRYELAPRKAWYVADREGDRWVFRDAPAPRDVPAWTVLAGDPDQPPRLVPTTDLLGRGLPPDPRRENKDLPAWVDDPPSAAVVPAAAFVIRGWCQEAGSRPCAQVYAFVDGRPIPLAVTRVPRADVCAAISAMRTCDRAGWEVRPSSPAPGEHELSVLFVAQSGSWRRIGWRFRSEP